MAVVKCALVQSLICSLFYFSTGAEVEQKPGGRNAAHVTGNTRFSSGPGCGLDEDSFMR